MKKNERKNGETGIFLFNFEIIATPLKLICSYNNNFIKSRVCLLFSVNMDQQDLQKLHYYLIFPI